MKIEVTYKNERTSFEVKEIGHSNCFVAEADFPVPGIGRKYFNDKQEEISVEEGNHDYENGRYIFYYTRE